MNAIDFQKMSDDSDEEDIPLRRNQESSISSTVEKPNTLKVKENKVILNRKSLLQNLQPLVKTESRISTKKGIYLINPFQEHLF